MGGKGGTIPGTTGGRMPGTPGTPINGGKPETIGSENSVIPPVMGVIWKGSHVVSFSKPKKTLTLPTCFAPGTGGAPGTACIFPSALATPGGMFGIPAQIRTDQTLCNVEEKAFPCA